MTMPDRKPHPIATRLARSRFIKSRFIKSQSGQSMTEYLVAMLVVMFMIGVSFTGQPSVIDMFLGAVKTGFENLSSFISLPL
jgi:Flp pilus assembly pilin Flp